MEEKKSGKKSISTKERLKDEIKRKMTELGLWAEELEAEIPTYWDNFNNYVIFNSKFFSSECWSEVGGEIWGCVSKIFLGKSLALQGKIQNDSFRSPTARIVYGESPWVEYLDHGIHYTWNVNFTMFCSGNVSERHRIASLDCRNKVVVDMFAGIGYFTLPYLVHAKSSKVFACEWNPVSIEALKKNLITNKVADRCEVLEGDVRINCPRGVADHVNLGLIPCCEEFWATAAEILNPLGGVLHVHGNVNSFSGSVNHVFRCETCENLVKDLGLSHGLKNLNKNSFTDFRIISDNKLAKIKHSDSHSVAWKKIDWFVWGIHVSHCFGEHLNTITDAKWTITPTLLHRVKAYAPHIDHIVVDIHCVNCQPQ